MNLLRLVLAAAVLSAAAPASAATYQVATTGSDSANGTTAPFRTFQRAVQALGDGDTILFHPGTYTAGSWIYASGVTIRGNGTGPVVLDGTAAAQVDGVNFYQSHGSTLADLSIVNCRRVGVFVGESNGVTIRNCEIRASAGAGILTGHSSDVTVERCTVANNGSHGVYFSESGDRGRVTASRVSGNQRAGIQINANQDDPRTADPNWDGLSHGCLVFGNVVDGNGALGGAAISLMGVWDSTIANNLVVQNTAAGMTLFDDGAGPGFESRNNRIAHNTIVSTVSRGYHGIRLEAGCTGNELLNNIIAWPSGPAIETDEAVASNFNVLSGASTVNDGSLAQWQAATGNDLNSTEGNPRLDAEYRLLDGSPALDGGLLLAYVDRDLDGVLRPQGPNADAGAYERVVVAPPPPPPTGLTARAGDTRVDLSWNAGSEPLRGWIVYRAPAVAGPWAPLHGTPVTTPAYADTGLTNGVTYWYRVCAVDLRGVSSDPSAAVSATPVAPPPPADAIYLDAMRPGWKAYGYRTQYSLSATSPVSQGTLSASVTMTGRNAYLRLSGTAIPLTGRQVLRFSLHGGDAGGQALRLRVLAGGTYQTGVLLSTYGVPRAGGWTDYTIPLSALGAAGKTLGAIKIYASRPQPTFFLDNVRVE